MIYCSINTMCSMARSLVVPIYILVAFLCALMISQILMFAIFSKDKD